MLFKNKVMDITI